MDHSMGREVEELVDDGEIYTDPDGAADDADGDRLMQTDKQTEMGTHPKGSPRGSPL